MKRTIRLGLLFIALCIVQQSQAQFEPLTCEEKVALYLPHTSRFGEFDQEYIDALLVEFTPCADSGNLDAKYILALLTYEDSVYNAHYLAYQKLSELKAQNYGPAYLALAMFYHDADEESFFFRRKHHHAKNNFLGMRFANNYKPDISFYLDGYYKLKGFDDRSSRWLRYTEAKHSFEQSNHPMAKHWLAVMHYFGLAVPQDKAKGLQMLRDNTILNSTTLADFLESQNNDWIPISAEEHYGVNTFVQSTPLLTPIEPAKLNKTFEGKLLEYEWSGTFVRRSVPFTLRLDIDTSTNYNQSLTYEFTINGTTISGIGNIKHNQIFFDDNFMFVLPRLYKDHPDKNELTYKINQVRFKERITDTETYFPGEVEFAYLVDFGYEEFYKLRMILRTSPAKTSSKQLGLTTISTQKTERPKPVLDKNFAAIAPNPIGNTFTITYTVDTDTEIEVAIYDMFSNRKVDVPIHKGKANIEQNIQVNSSALTTGNYIVQMIINGIPYSKLVVKE